MLFAKESNGRRSFKKINQKGQIRRSQFKIELEFHFMNNTGIILWNVEINKRYEQEVISRNKVINIKYSIHLGR